MKESFFNKHYNTPKWLKDKLSRRQLLKSAAGTSALAAIPFSSLTFAQKEDVESTLNAEPWLTLNAVLNHLLPNSEQGISATDIKATYYLYQLIHQQPTATDEINFIYKGVGWLNSYSQKKTDKVFIALTPTDKEEVLRDISRSTAGDNWISMLISNLYEAMLTPPSYGGNPNGIGWKWLEHQAGFPLPEAGERYFELPQRSKQAATASKHIIPTRNTFAGKPRTQGTTKA
ncbi:gluconate 2-dehydrogenase subunit 3 family protein [Thalassotalea piscium]|uniref:Gluconate 2-dehydrogenase gamma chain n=1 Tax=Thalassotalea piscium TaxID=1230533 RepID=A0A7X0NGC3_9GAMM|nr:gluconate 2-dehydrogenase subunit 3 family protein [Thalassotalea piscium]MBB6542870.1 gluconate 2-dehydrogenase gamma chain [Thalassotalea piscium]